MLIYFFQIGEFSFQDEKTNSEPENKCLGQYVDKKIKYSEKDSGFCSSVF